MTQAYSNYNVMGKVDCICSRDVTQSRFLVIFFDKFKIKMLKKGANNGICLCYKLIFGNASLG